MSWLYIILGVLILLIMIDALFDDFISKDLMAFWKALEFVMAELVGLLKTPFTRHKCRLRLNNANNTELIMVCRDCAQTQVWHRKNFYKSMLPEEPRSLYKWNHSYYILNGAPVCWIPELAGLQQTMYGDPATKDKPPCQACHGLLWVATWEEARLL